MQDFYDCLKPLTMGNAADVNVESVRKKFIGKELKLAEHLQNVIYGFCYKKPASNIGVDTLVTLVDLCYSSSALPGLTNMDRYASGLAAVSDYFLQNSLLTKAMEMCAFLDKKRSSLVSASVTCGLVRDCLFIMHHHLVGAAVKHQHQDIAFQLLDASLTPLKYICTSDTRLAQKVVRNYKCAISNFKTVTKINIGQVLIQAKQIIRVLSGSSAQYDIVFEDYLTQRICIKLIIPQANSVEPAILSERCKQEISILLQLSELSTLGEDWKVVVDTFVTLESSVESGVAAANRILQCGGALEDKQRACLLLSCLFPLERWSSCSTEDTQLLFNKFVMLIWKESSAFRHYSLEVGEGQHVCLLENLARCFVTVASLCRSNLKMRMLDALTLVPVAAEAFQLCQICLQQMTSCDETLQNYLWSHAAVRIANIIEDLLGHGLEGNDGAWSSLRNYCRAVIPLFATSNRKLPIERRRMALLFDRWHLACTKLSEIEEAMLLRALQVCTCPLELDEAVLSWAQSKLSDGKPVKTATFLDYLKRNEKELRLWKVDVTVIKMNQKELLLAEARAYQAIGTSAADAAVKNLWSVFNKLRPSLFELAYLLSCVMMCGGQLQHEYRRVMDLLAARKESESAVRVRCMCYEGVLKFAMFTCIARQSREDGASHESRTVLLNLLKAEAEEKAKFGEDVDLNVTCDVAAALTVDGESATVAVLASALAAWLPVPDAWTPHCLPQDELALTLQHLHLIGNAAALYGDVRLTVRGWVLLYQLASLAEDDVEQLWAVSMLMKVCGVSENSPLIKAAQALADKLLEGSQTDKLPQTTLEALLNYWLSLIQVYLIQGNYEAAAAQLEECQGAVRHVKGVAEYLMLRGRILCYSSQVHLAAPHTASSVNISVQQEAYSAFHHLKSALKTATEWSASSKLQGHLLLTTLDVSTWGAELFLFLLQTPYVRAFIEDVYTLCQTLRLTGRTTQILCLLVQVDLVTRELTEAQLKLSNLSSMLNLPPLPHAQPVQMKKTGNSSTRLQIPSPCSISSCEVSPVRCQLSQLNVTMLPRQASKNDVGPSCRTDTSPLPMLLQPNTGSVAQHLTSCSCYLCSSVLLQLAALTARSCEALAAAFSGDVVTAAACYQYCDAALQAMADQTSNTEQCWETTVNVTRYRRDAEAELARAFPGEVIPQIQRDLEMVWAKVSVSYASFALAPDSPASLNTVRLLKTADQLVARLTVTRPLLEWALLELHICRFIHLQNKQSVKVPDSDSVPAPHLEAKTPHVTRVHFLTEAQQAAPNKCAQIEPQPAETPAARPKRGRRIFDEPSSPAKHPTLRKALATPATTRKPVIATAATSVRVAASGVTTRRRKVRVMLSSSDSDIPATPSPTCKSVIKVAKVTKQLKPVPLIFDESEDVESGSGPSQDVSKDLFESFEKALKTSEPEPKITGRKKKNAGSKQGRKVATTTSAKVNSCR